MARGEGGSGAGGTDEFLQRVEERVSKVRHLEPFGLNVRDDGRFTCELKKPIEQLSPDQLREALEMVRSLERLLQARLDETEGD